MDFNTFTSSKWIEACLCVFSILVVACSVPNDQGLDFEATALQNQEGFYTQATLDSGRAFHSISDSLSVQIKNYFVITPCIWQKSTLEAFDTSSVADSLLDSTALSVHVKLELSGNNSLDCPQTGEQGDTTLVFAPDSSQWSLKPKLQLWGLSKLNIIPVILNGDTVVNSDNSISILGGDTVINSADTLDRRTILLDEIQMRVGSSKDSILQVRTDSLGVVDSVATNVKLLRHQVGTNTKEYIVNSYNRIYGEECTQPLNGGCPAGSTNIPDTVYSVKKYQYLDSIVINDTLRVDSSKAIDTLSVTYGERCSNFKQYCSSQYWSRTTNSLGNSKESFSFAIYETFLIEKLESCQRINFAEIKAASTLGNGVGRLNAGRRSIVYREIFTLADFEENCAASSEARFWGATLGQKEYWGAGISNKKKNLELDSLKLLPLKEQYLTEDSLKTIWEFHTK